MRREDPDSNLDIDDGGAGGWVRGVCGAGFSREGLD